MSPITERAIAERARTQLGLVTRSQARDVGLSRKVVARRLASGSLLALSDEVLAVGGAPPSWERDVMAACLDVSGVASHRSAAWLHRMEGFARPSGIEVVTRKGRRATRSALARVHATTNLTPEDVVSVGGIPTTSIARTMLDLSKLVLHRELDRASLVTAVESTVRERRASDRWLWWLLEERRCRGRDGVSVMESVLAERAHLGPTESWLERETLRILAEAGLPLPRVQRRFTRRGAFVSRVDFAYDDRPVAIEVEGKAHLTPAQAAIDVRQRDELQLMGITILTFTYQHVVDDPGWVVDSVRRARALRAAA